MEDPTAGRKKKATRRRKPTTTRRRRPNKTTYRQRQSSNVVNNIRIGRGTTHAPLQAPSVISVPQFIQHAPPPPPQLPSMSQGGTTTTINNSTTAPEPTPINNTITNTDAGGGGGGVAEALGAGIVGATALGASIAYGNRERERRTLRESGRATNTQPQSRGDGGQTAPLRVSELQPQNPSRLRQFELQNPSRSQQSSLPIVEGKESEDDEPRPPPRPSQPPTLPVTQRSTRSRSQTILPTPSDRLSLGDLSKPEEEEDMGRGWDIPKTKTKTKEEDIGAGWVMPKNPNPRKPTTHLQDRTPQTNPAPQQQPINPTELKHLAEIKRRGRRITDNENRMRMARQEINTAKHFVQQIAQKEEPDPVLDEINKGLKSVSSKNIQSEVYGRPAVGTPFQTPPQRQPPRQSTYTPQEQNASRRIRSFMNRSKTNFRGRRRLVERQVDNLPVETLEKKWGL